MRRVPPNRAAIAYVEELRAGRGAPLASSPLPVAPSLATTPPLVASMTWCSPAKQPAAAHAVSALRPAPPAAAPPTPRGMPSGFVSCAIAAAVVGLLVLVVAILAVCSVALAQEHGVEPSASTAAADRGDRQPGDRQPRSRRERRVRHRGLRTRDRPPCPRASAGPDVGVSSNDASVLNAGAATDAGLPLCLGPITPVPYLSPSPEPVPPPQPPVAHTNVPPIPGTFLLALGALAAALTLVLFRARRAPRIVPVPPEVAGVEAREAASANAAAEPIATSLPRHLAIESRKGPVRARCEDRSAVFEVGNVVGIVTGDGMGGHPDGEAAAEIAVDSARRALVRELGRADRILSLPVLARAAIGAAAGALRRAAPAFAYRPDDAALSTTLLVLLADRELYVAAYLGDGGIVVARADGSVEVLMEPQNGEAPNIVEGCVGPSGIEGRPEVRTAPRRPGDVALVGTDGVFARVPADFPPRMRNLVVRRADAALAIHEALDALEAVRDEHGPVADDNLSLGALWTEG